jgi:UDP-N-acetylglucosamine 2-epimerase (non-hydrolysing)
MTKPRIHLIAGARPNFMKIAPIVRALKADARLEYRLVHTGQHHDREMNDVFFEELGIPQPHVRLFAGGGSHAQQTSAILLAYESLCQQERPAAVIVVGDVNSTLACAIVAKKLCIPVAHVEAGLRSGDMAMPEEINRLVTDAISDWFFVTEPSAREHLRREGKPAKKIYEVGHVMVDNLLYQADKLGRMDPSGLESDAFKRRHARYGVVTLHRPSNVDSAEALQRVAEALRTISQDLPLAFPVHPRTRKNMEKFGIEFGPNVELMGPQPYMSFLHLWKDAAVVLTDSGGMQEETTALGVACVTLRENTERPITLKEGTNVLAGTDPKAVIACARRAIAGASPRGRRPALWDGRSAARIVQILATELVAVKRIEILGCQVDNLSMDETLEVIGGLIASGQPHRHVVVNVDKVVKASYTPELRQIINSCALINADGMPVVWASRLLGKPLKARVAGVDLFEALMKRAAEKGWRVYLLGAREEIVAQVKFVYERKHSGLVVAGYRNGYWKPHEEAQVAEEIRAARPDILFVAISSPRKEQFLSQWQEHMKVPFAMGVGGTFDVAAGYVKRAPLWMQRAGFEWFYRFLQEPRRMFKRYFIDDMAFFGMLAKAMWRRYRAFGGTPGTVLQPSGQSDTYG